MWRLGAHDAPPPPLFLLNHWFSDTWSVDLLNSVFHAMPPEHANLLLEHVDLLSSSLTSWARRLLSLSSGPWACTILLPCLHLHKPSSHEHPFSLNPLRYTDQFDTFCIQPQVRHRESSAKQTLKPWNIEIHRHLKP